MKRWITHIFSKALEQAGSRGAATKLRQREKWGREVIVAMPNGDAFTPACIAFESAHDEEFNDWQERNGVVIIGLHRANRRADSRSFAVQL